jgi:hypothetical protein
MTAKALTGNTPPSATQRFSDRCLRAGACLAAKELTVSPTSVSQSFTLSPVVKD